MQVLPCIINSDVFSTRGCLKVEKSCGKLCGKSGKLRFHAVFGIVEIFADSKLDSRLIEWYNEECVSPNISGKNEKNILMGISKYSECVR